MSLGSSEESVCVSVCLSEESVCVCPCERLRNSGAWDETNWDGMGWNGTGWLSSVSPCAASDGGRLLPV